MKCLITNQELTINTGVRTTDHQYLAKIIYDEVCLQLKKGLLNSEEVKNYFKEKEEYENKLYQLGVEVLKKGVKGKSKTEAIKELVNLEEEKSIKELKKTRNCLSMWEHSKLIEQITEELKQDNKEREEYRTQKEASTRISNFTKTYPSVTQGIYYKNCKGE